MGIIYKIANSATDKVYVGQTTRPLQIRWREHLRDSETTDNRLYRAMRKYGRDKFFISVVEECDDALLNSREVFWISEFNSYKDGYNSTFGGDGVRLDCYSHKFIPVVQYDKQGNKIAEYESAIDAEEKTGISRAAICCVCKGAYKSVRGFQWKYKEDEQEVMPVDTNTRRSANYSVVQFSLSGHRLNTFASEREATRACGGGSSTGIRRCLNGTRKTAYGYQWRLDSDVADAGAIEPTPYTGKGGRPFKNIKMEETQNVHD